MKGVAESDPPRSRKDNWMNRLERWLYRLRRKRRGKRIKKENWSAHKHPPIDIVNTGDKEADKYTNLKKMNESIEKIVLDNPTEWWWVHRRWKRSYRYENESENGK